MMLVKKREQNEAYEGLQRRQASQAPKGRMLPGDKLPAPGELTQCLFSKITGLPNCTMLIV